MKFIKNNLVPLICGLVVLLALGAMYWPFGVWKDQLAKDMEDRLNQGRNAEAQIHPITIPEYQGPPINTVETNVIDAMNYVQKRMHEMATAIETDAAQHNREGRVVEIRDPRTHEISKLIPIMGNTQLDNFLPKFDRSKAKHLYDFKITYNDLPPKWEKALVNASGGALGVPMSDTDVHAAIESEQAKAKLGPPGGMGGGNVDPTQQLEAIRRIVANRAADIHMYVDPGCFQRQSWVTQTALPTEAQMFESLVESWCQQDIVNTILDVNRGSGNVGQSPVKRLESIQVGPAAIQQGAPTGMGAPAAMGSSTGSTGTAMFVLSTSPAAALAATPPLAGSPPGSDLNHSMTGRVGSDQFDVVPMRVVIDINPAYENRFIEALYRHNNGYTVINIRSTTVDPLDAVSHGYLYGNTQVVHLDIQLEGVLFRSWTTLLMPDVTKTQLGITPAPAVPGT